MNRHGAEVLVQSAKTKHMAYTWAESTLSLDTPDSSRERKGGGNEMEKEKTMISRLMDVVNPRVGTACARVHRYKANCLQCVGYLLATAYMFTITAPNSLSNEDAPLHPPV